MSLFLAGVAVLGIVAALIAADVRRGTARDTLGLRAARREAVTDMRRRVYRERLARVDRLRIPASFWSAEDGRQRLAEFHREDR